MLDLYLKTPTWWTIYHTAEQIFYIKPYFTSTVELFPTCQVSLVVLIVRWSCSSQSQVVSKAGIYNSWARHVLNFQHDGTDRASVTSPLYTDVSTLGNTAIPSLICLTLRNLTNHTASDLTVWNTKENIKIQFRGLPTRSAPGRQQRKLCSSLSVSPSERNSDYCWSWDLPASHSYFVSQPFVTLHLSWMKKYFFSSA